MLSTLKRLENCHGRRRLKVDARMYMCVREFVCVGKSIASFIAQAYSPRFKFHCKR